MSIVTFTKRQIIQVQRGGRPMLFRKFAVLVRLFHKFLLFPFLFPFAYLAVTGFSIAKGKRYLFAEVVADRLGGWAATVDGFLRRTRTGMDRVEYVYVIHQELAVNAYFCELMKRHVTVVENRLLEFLLLPIVRINSSLRVSDQLNTLIRPKEVGMYPPIGWFNDEDHRRGRDVLTRLGVTEKDAWYACFFARDPEHFRTQLSEIDFLDNHAQQSNRNSDINTFIEAMKFILDQGGYVIRIGRIAAKPVGFSHPRLIDYPFSENKSDFADIYIPCHGKFLIGEQSGPADMSVIVDMPRGITNADKLCSVLGYPLAARKNAIFIPKLMRFRDKDRYVSIREFKQLLGPSASGHNADYVEAVRRNNITYEDNSAEDILMVTKAMYNQFVVKEGRKSKSQEDDFFEAGLNPGNEIWPGFLERHPELLN